MALIRELPGISKSLLPYVQSGEINFLIGSGASFPAISLAGNIEKDINNLLIENKEGDANLLALSFIEKLELESARALSGRARRNGRMTIQRYKDFFGAIDSLLFDRKNYLLPKQANIYTTNYDIFIEKACSEISTLVVSDGFDRKSSVLGSYRFSPEVYSDRTYRSGPVYIGRQSEMPTINIFKLHGSLNWRKEGEAVYYSEISTNKLSEKEKEDADLVNQALSEKALILPNLKKFGSALMDHIYYDLLRFLAGSFDKENSVLFVFGFSFSDEHILEVVKRGLRNPTSQVVTFAYSRDEAEKFMSIFSSHRNVIVVNPPEDGFIGIEKVTEIMSTIQKEVE